MMRIASVAFALAFTTACSSGGSGGGESTSAGTVAGTVGGKSFTTQSGIGFVAKDGSVDIVLSDAAALCQSLVDQKFRAGTTIVQAYGLTGSAPGAFKPKDGDVKYASIKTSCASGQSIDDAVDHHARATTNDITISAITASEVRGKINVEFSDGSSVAGEFRVPICAQQDAEHATCY